MGQFIIAVSRFGVTARDQAVVGQRFQDLCAEGLLPGAKIEFNRIDPSAGEFSALKGHKAKQQITEKVDMLLERLQNGLLFLLQNLPDTGIIAFVNGPFRPVFGLFVEFVQGQRQ